MNILQGFILIKGIPFLMFSTFVCIFLGLLLGRITFKGISLGSSGVFIMALLYGALFSSHIKSTISQTSKDGKSIDISTNGLKIIENIGLILFIGSVGFISGPNFFTNLKKNFKSYLIVGLLVILTSTLVSVIIFYIGKKSEENIEEFTAMMAGIFAGSLTSTPAFSAAKASAEGEFESAVTVGYGLAYIFGVLGIVLFVQIIPKISNVDMDIERDLIVEKEYKITKRVGTDRTDQTERTRIGRSLSGEIKQAEKIDIMKMKPKKKNKLEKNENEKEKDSKKSKFYHEISVPNEKKEEEHISENNKPKKKNEELETKNNTIISDINIKSSQNSNMETEKEKYVIEEEKENEDNQEEKENEDNQEEKENEDNNQEEKENEEEENNQEEKENEDNNQEEKEISENIKNPEKLFVLDKYGFCVFGFGSLIGIFIGAIRIPLSKEIFNGSTFSLTTTGGVLLTCLILGHIGKIKKLSLKVDKKVLENLRELGLILFLLGSGIAGGTKFIEYFKIIYFFYGIFITIIPLIVGFLFNKYVLKLCLLNNLGSLTGAMTSTPALGTLINVAKTDCIGNSYAATYPISLITVVLSAQFMVLLLK